MEEVKIKIVDLPTDTELRGNEFVPVMDDGVTKKVTLNQVEKFVLNRLMDSGIVTSITDSYLVIRSAAGEAKKVSIADFTTALSSVLVSMAGDATISGNKTFANPVAVATPTANNHAATKGYVDGIAETKVTVVEGKMLSSNDFTDALLAKLNGIAAGAEKNAVASVNSKTGAVFLTAADVGAASDTPTFDKPDELTEPVGKDETTPTLWGKLWKAISTLVAHISDSVIHVTSAERTSWNGKQDALTFDDAPTSGSNNPVKSGGVFAAIANFVTNDIFNSHKNDANVHVTAAEKADWNAKSGALTFDDKPVSGSENPVKSGGIFNAIKDFVTLTAFNSHKDNNTVHISASERTTWNGKQDALTIDAAPTSGSTNPVSSGGVFKAIAEGGMTIDPTPTSGSTNPVASGGVATALEGKVSTTDFAGHTSDSVMHVTSAERTTWNGKQDVGNLVVSWSAVPSDSKYPSEKLVKQAIDDIAGDVVLNKYQITDASTFNLNLTMSSAKECGFFVSDARSSTCPVNLSFRHTVTDGTVQHAKALIYTQYASNMFTTVQGATGTRIKISGDDVSGSSISTQASSVYLIDCTVFNTEASTCHATVIVKKL